MDRWAEFGVFEIHIRCRSFSLLSNVDGLAKGSCQLWSRFIDHLDYISSMHVEHSEPTHTHNAMSLNDDADQKYRTSYHLITFSIFARAHSPQ